jgi:hypothetical protein
MSIGKPQEENHFGDQSVDNRTILKLILHKYGVRAWNRFIWLRIMSNGRP